MEEAKYRELRKYYPKYVSKEQLRIICQISKRSAKYLLDNGVIPCEDSGKKTRCYRIALKDIIAYMKKCDKTGNSLIPRGEVSSKYKKVSDSKIFNTQKIIFGQENEVRRYFEYILLEFPDVLNSYDVMEMSGLSHTTIQRLLKSGVICSWIIDRKYIVLKAYMIDFMTSRKFLNMKSNSINFKKILGGFSVWKTQK